MKATAGEVYTVYNQYLKRYTACQVAYIAPPDSVSKQPWAVILSLQGSFCALQSTGKWRWNARPWNTMRANSGCSAFLHSYFFRCR